jgi:hypothetical protein
VDSPALFYFSNSQAKIKKIFGTEWHLSHSPRIPANNRRSARLPPLKIHTATEGQYTKDLEIDVVSEAKKFRSGESPTDIPLSRCDATEILSITT